MKKRAIIPAFIVMGFFAGCDWSSWCSCSKKEDMTNAKTATTSDQEQDHDDRTTSKMPAHLLAKQNAAKALNHPDFMSEEDHDMMPENAKQPVVNHENESPMLAALARGAKK